MPFPYFKSNTHMQNYSPGLMMLLSWLIALQQIFFLHSNHFEQISQIQNFNALNIKRETDSEAKMIAIDQSRKRGAWTGDGTLLSVKMRAIHRVNSSMRSPPRLLHFPTIALLFVILIYIIYISAWKGLGSAESTSHGNINQIQK